jgi:hypothetical protein
MFFAQQSIENMAADFAAISGRRDEVLDAFLSRAYAVPRAKEFAEHGVSRRLMTMTHCIEKVFNALPPEREGLPSKDELSEAVVNIQAFIFNTFASLDNLAWIWVCEKKLTTDRGEPVAPAYVGLGKKCRIVRRSLPPDLRAYLKSLNPWFDHLESFRHALAHRIPLYIPPCVITEADLPAYRQLERQKERARRRGNHNRYDQLDAAQKALTKFQPEMLHSAADNSKRIVFHPQLLSDFKTVCELSLKMNAALDGDPVVGVRRTFWSWVFTIRDAVTHFIPRRSAG